MMNRYELEAAAHKIDGYYFYPPINHTGATKPKREEVFEAAKAECLLHLEKSLENVRAITFEEFLKGRR